MYYYINYNETNFGLQMPHSFQVFELAFDVPHNASAQHLLAAKEAAILQRPVDAFFDKDFLTSDESNVCFILFSKYLLLHLNAPRKQQRRAGFGCISDFVKLY